MTWFNIFALTGRKQKVEGNICVVRLIFAALPALSHIALHNNPVDSHGEYPLETGLPCGLDSKESACNARDPGSIPQLERSPGEGNGNPLQYSCLENFMDRRTL